jgi:hypothetical protein
MEWVDGTRLVDGAELAVYTGDAKAGTRLVDALVQCSLRQMLDSGFFHADPPDLGVPSCGDAFTSFKRVVFERGGRADDRDARPTRRHAGNLLATDDGRLCYLDFGMMSYLEERQRVSIIEAVVHLVNRDFEALADLYVRMGFIKAGTDVKPIVRGLQDALPDVLDAPVSELNVKNVTDAASFHTSAMAWRWRRRRDAMSTRDRAGRESPRRRHVHVPLRAAAVLRGYNQVSGRARGRRYTSRSWVPNCQRRVPLRRRAVIN